MSLDEAIRNKISQDPFARANGVELLELRPGYARMSMPVKPDMVNFHGSTHGGALFTLADAAFAAACNSHGQTAVALNVNISYLTASFPGVTLVAEAMEESLGKRTALYHITVTDDTGQLVASCHAVAYRKQERLA